ncbi:P-loop NTPase fold protein [Lacticaseibacillus rhamnosus]|uniref:P-loop NTPase fold protein n=1 Tax=Lacticaseibacillus rhamnosus TaxID=47715 RepID=UPI0007DFC898|nr:P-loop NTPase fold protein [Lacticaseibacillus rhamnosus]OAT93561.1 hypothetical protein PY94_10310 [Lacticaseibacillus rhamnosus]
MKHSQLLEGLSNYVNGHDQFAVMIDGPWGSGKTFFLKNTLIPYFCKKHKVVYFSVYGYESLAKLKSELIGNLFMSSFSKETDKAKTPFKTEDIVSIVKEVGSAVWEKVAAFKTIAEITESFVINKQLRSQNQKHSPVLIIDDLERISREIHTSDLMGFLLTDIIEQYGYRVIIAGNSQEIRKVESNEFDMTREKVISRTFPFLYDLENVKREFLQNSESQFLRDDSSWLVEILAEFVRRNEGQLNLRTLEFILTTFQLIEKRLSQYWNENTEGKAYVLQIKRSAFANLFVIATEYRQGKLNRENLSAIDRLLDTRNFFFLPMDDNKEKSEAEKITVKYHDDKNLSQVVMYNDSVNNAVFNGVFDAKSFIRAWVKLFKSEVEISNLDKIDDFRNMTDNQLEHLEKQLINDSRNSIFSVKDTLLLINDFLFFEKNDLIFCDGDYLSVLLDALKKAATGEMASNGYLYDRDKIGFLYSVLADDKDVLKKVQDVFDSVEIVKRQSNTDQLINAIFEGDYRAMRMFTQSGLSVNIFRAILDSNRLKTELLTTDSKAFLLDKYLHSVYISVSNFKENHPGESSDISEFIHKIEMFTGESTEISKIDRFNLNSLVNTSKKILSEL